MLRRQCTAEYKINVFEQVIRRQVVGLEYRQRMPKGVKVVQYFGLSTTSPGGSPRSRTGSWATRGARAGSRSSTWR